MFSNQLEATNKHLKKLATTASLALAIFLTIIKTFGVLYTGSLSVLSSMIDSLADIFASLITFFAVHISSRPADKEHRYGHGKAEALSALIQSAFICGSGFFIIYDAVIRFLSPRTIPQSWIGIIIMIISLILTICLIIFQHYVAKRTKSQAIIADALHYYVDVITNFGIIFSLFIVHQWNIFWIDTITAIIVSAYLIFNAYKLATDAISLLMDKELDDSIREHITKIALSSDHIMGIHDLRSRNMGDKYIFELHLELDGNLALAQAHQYTNNVEKSIKQAYPGAQIIIHQDPSGTSEPKLDKEIKI